MVTLQYCRSWGVCSWEWESLTLTASRQSGEDGITVMERAESRQLREGHVISLCDKNAESLMVFGEHNSS